MKFPIIYIKGTNLILGGYEFSNIITSRLTIRIPEYSMTNDPEKVWPGGIVRYAMDTSLGKYLDVLHAQYIIEQSNTCTILVAYT